MSRRSRGGGRAPDRELHQEIKSRVKAAIQETSRADVNEKDYDALRKNNGLEDLRIEVEIGRASDARVSAPRPDEKRRKSHQIATQDAKAFRHLNMSERVRSLDAAVQLFAESAHRGQRLDVFARVRDQLDSRTERIALSLYALMPDKEYFIERGSMPSRQEVEGLAGSTRKQVVRDYAQAAAHFARGQTVDVNSPEFRSAARYAFTLKVMDELKSQRENNKDPYDADLGLADNGESF